MVLVHTQAGCLTVLEQMCDVRTTGYHDQQLLPNPNLHCAFMCPGARHSKVLQCLVPIVTQKLSVGVCRASMCYHQVTKCEDCEAVKAKACRKQHHFEAKDPC